MAIRTEGRPQLAIWLVGWLVGCLDVWLVGWLCGWLVVWLVLCVVGGSGIIFGLLEARIWNR